MMCLKSRLFFLSLVVLFFSFSVSSFAEVCLSDEEFMELETIFSELETISEERKAQVETLQTDLTISRRAQERLNAEISGVRISLDGAERSLVEQGKATMGSIIIAAIVGIAAGLIVGLFL